MASDYEGEPKEFAVVVPVPSFIKRDQINVVDPKTIDHLDAYTAPRLVEYFDEDPCAPRVVCADGVVIHGCDTNVSGTSGAASL